MDHLTAAYNEQIKEWEFQERCTLALMFSKPETARKAIVDHHLTKNHFYFAHTRAIYRAIERAFSNGDNWTRHEIAAELIESGGIHDTDGLIELADLIRLSKHIPEFLDIDCFSGMLQDAQDFRTVYNSVTRYGHLENVEIIQE